jgi:hypothetical protein
MESITQEVNKEQNQQVFDEETRRKIQASLQKLDNKQQQQQQQNSSSSLAGGKRFVKFAYDGEHKRLSFTGQHSEETIPYKDFKTKEIVEGKFSERYYFECHDITDPNHPPSELSVWERGSREARTILFWLSKNKNVLDVTRRGQPGSMTTTYDIYPAMD